MPSGRRRQALERGVVRRHHHGVRALERRLERLGLRGHVRVVAGHVRELALEQADELEGERVAHVVRVALEGQAEHGHLEVAQRAAQPRLEPLDEEQRDRLVHARHGQQHAWRARALLGEGEVLAQAGARRQPGPADAAARVVVVDQVDHVEDVRAVLLALHHQQVRQGELRVAQDVRPDLRELRLHRGGLDDLGAEHLEQLGRLRARSLAHAADDARQRGDLLQEVVLRDPLGHVRDEQLLAHLEAAPLLDVAGHPLGGARRDGRAQDQRVARAQHRQQVVEDAADLRDVDLDVP